MHRVMFVAFLLTACGGAVDPLPFEGASPGAGLPASSASDHVELVAPSGEPDPNSVPIRTICIDGIQPAVHVERIRNRGVRTMTLRIDAWDAGFLAIDPAELVIAPGEEAAVAMTAQPFSETDHSNVSFRRENGDRLADIDVHVRVDHRLLEVTSLGYGDWLGFAFGVKNPTSFIARGQFIEHDPVLHVPVVGDIEPLGASRVLVHAPNEAPPSPGATVRLNGPRCSPTLTGDHPRIVVPLKE